MKTLTAGGAGSGAGILALLAFANFVVGIGAFVVIGVLTPVTTGFALEKAEAGWMMTVYALVYAATSPILVALTGARERRAVMAVGLFVFALGAVVAVLAPSYPVLLLARVIMALGGGLVTPVAASIAAALATPEARGRALAIVFGGLTLSQVFGTPLGTWLGYTYGWRATFALVAALCLGAAIVLRFALPAAIETPRASLAALGRALATPRLTLAVAFTAFFIGGIYVPYTYMGPFLEERLAIGGDGVSALLVVFGVGAVLGNVMGGLLTDRIGSTRTLLLLVAVQVVTMPVLFAVPYGLLATTGLILFWSVFGWSFMVAQQARLSALDPPLTPILFALNAAAIYVGGAIGPLAGGVAIRTAGIEATGFVGAAVVLIGAVTLLLVARLSARPA